MNFEGYVEVEPTPWGTELERALEVFMQGDPPVVFNYDPEKRLGTVTRIAGDESKVRVWGTLEAPPPRTVARDAYNKVLSGTLKGLAIAGDFTGTARIDAVVVTAIPVDGSGFITKVGE